MSPPPRTAIEVCILAGGLSTRMGRDKARLKVGGITMLARIRAVAEGLTRNEFLTRAAGGLAGHSVRAAATERALPRRTQSDAPSLGARVRIITKDSVRRCGPLGGILTALRTSKACAVLFLACDMPLISPALLRRLVRASREGKLAAIVSQHGRVGFPCVLPVADSLPILEAQIAAQEFALHTLAKKIKARRVTVSFRSRDLFNVNSAEDVPAVEQLLAKVPRPSAHSS